MRGPTYKYQLIGDVLFLREISEEIQSARKAWGLIKEEITDIDVASLKEEGKIRILVKDIRGCWDELRAPGGGWNRIFVVNEGRTCDVDEAIKFLNDNPIH
jgi:hypothetical protein